jgi:F-type H+-transporting ATPase subunit gamma
VLQRSGQLTQPCILNPKQYLKKRYNVVANYPIGNAPTAEEATKISDTVLASFLAGECDRVEMTYTKFTSLVASEPSVRTMLPLSPTGIESEGDEIFMMTSKDGDFAVEKVPGEAVEPAKFPKDMIFEQDPEQILSAILPLYFNGQILRQMQESVASELAARMTAMQSATDNASDLIKVLTQQVPNPHTRMNRHLTRQMNRPHTTEALSVADCVAEALNHKRH